MWLLFPNDSLNKRLLLARHRASGSHHADTPTALAPSPPIIAVPSLLLLNPAHSSSCSLRECHASPRSFPSTRAPCSHPHTIPAVADNSRSPWLPFFPALSDERMRNGPSALFFPGASGVPPSQALYPIRCGIPGTMYFHPQADNLI